MHSFEQQGKEGQKQPLKVQFLDNFSYFNKNLILLCLEESYVTPVCHVLAHSALSVNL